MYLIGECDCLSNCSVLSIYVYIFRMIIDMGEGFSVLLLVISFNFILFWFL